MSSAETPALEVKNLVAGYGDYPVVDGVSLTVPHGQVVAVAGPNGAGKSTLLKAMLGLVRILSGRVLLEGEDITGAPLERLGRLGVGYVPSWTMSLTP